MVVVQWLQIAEEMPVLPFNPIVVPARGGVGEVVEYQANVIASVLAERLRGTYKMLHLPDGLSKTHCICS